MHLTKYHFFLCVLFASFSCLAERLPVPAVIKGVCTTCGTPSCSNCRKFSASRQTTEDNKAKACSKCENKGDFCSDERSDCFTDACADRGVCRQRRCGMTYLPYSAFIPRSQGTNTARELVGWEEFIHQFDVGDYYVTTGHSLSYSHSFRPERIARELFGESVLRFAGSQVEDRGPCELLADNFGLSATLRGRVTVRPTIENIIFDNQVFIGLDPIACGLYVRFHMPIVHTRWNLNLCQTIETNHQKVCPGFPACYMAEDEVPADCDIIAALTGQRTFGDMQEPWEYGRIINGEQTKTGVADIDLIVGYDFRQTDTSHLGLYAQFVLPTGNKFTGRQVFQPIVGNAKHFEMGIGISSHVVLYEYDAESSLAFYLEGNVVHMFSNHQMRSFDLCNNGPLSRYMLLKELERVDGQLQYSGNLINAINVVTKPVSVSIAAKGDISAKLAVRTPHIIADLGYNFFGQTGEDVCFKNCKDDRIFAIKGTEGVCALEYQTVGEEPPFQFGDLVRKIPLNSSQNNATIRRGAMTDNPVRPQKEDPTDIVVTAFSTQEGSIEGEGVMRAFESSPPKPLRFNQHRIIATDDLHKASGELPAQATHKVFGYLGYNCFEYDWCANPYLGIGGEAEFDARSCDERTALNQWSVFIKGGFEF